MPSKKKNNTPAKKDNRKKIDDEIFAQMMAEGKTAPEAYVAAGGSGANPNQAAVAVKRRTQERVKEIILEKATDSVGAMVTLAPKAVAVISEALSSEEVKLRDRALLAKDLLNNIQGILPKQTLHEHKHTHELNDNDIQEAASLLYAQLLSGEIGAGNSKVIEADFEEQSGASEDAPTGSEEKPE